MRGTITWARLLMIVGLAGMLLGAIDPLEGSLIILPSTGLVALGAFLDKSRRRVLLYWALASMAVGVGAMFVLSALGGIGGSTGLSIWWALLILPYVVGWFVGLAGAILVLIESFRRPPQTNRSEQNRGEQAGRV